MKHINQFITEYIIKKKLDKPIDSSGYKYYPKNTDELMDILAYRISETKEKNFNDIDTSKITDMSYLFAMKNLKSVCKLSSFDLRDRLLEININDWDVSNVENMEHMFDTSPVTVLNFDFSNWDVSNVTNMYKMFYQCNSFTGKGLNKWNTSSLENAESMFNGCNYFNENIGNWNVSNLKNSSFMFAGCYKFNQDLSKWDISNINDMQSMFIYCEQLKQDFSTWNIDQNKVDCFTMFKGCNKMKDELLPKGITI